MILCPECFISSIVFLNCWFSLCIRRTSIELTKKYRKIPKISLGAYIFQRPFLRGLYSEGLIYGGKFAFQNQLGFWGKFTFFALFFFVFSKYKPPGASIWRGDLTEGFLRYRLGSLIFGRAYFRNFTVSPEVHNSISTILFSDFYGIFLAFKPHWKASAKILIYVLNFSCACFARHLQTAKLI